MDLIGAKVIVLILLGLVKLGSGLGPLLLVRFVKKEGMQWIENFMAGLMCFGGGVLLATVFIHMLPEVRESLETSMKDNGVDPTTIQGSYPFGELVSKMLDRSFRNCKKQLPSSSFKLLEANHNPALHNLALLELGSIDGLILISLKF